MQVLVTGSMTLFTSVQTHELPDIEKFAAHVRHEVSLVQVAHPVIAAEQLLHIPYSSA